MMGLRGEWECLLIFRWHWQSTCTALMAGKCLLLGLCKGTVKESDAPISSSQVSCGRSVMSTCRKVGLGIGRGHYIMVPHILGIDFMVVPQGCQRVLNFNILFTWIFFSYMNVVKFWFQTHWMLFPRIWLTPKHRETHGCVVSTVATDVLVLKHQAISIHNAD